MDDVQGTNLGSDPRFGSTLGLANLLLLRVTERKSGRQVMGSISGKFAIWRDYALLSHLRTSYFTVILFGKTAQNTM
jgi:hypothetical protein